MAKSIEAIEGIGKVYGDKLRNVGCGSAKALLEKGGTRKGRNALAKETGVSPSIIMRCVNMADLFRIKGVASQYAELLEGAGVDSVKELKRRRPDNLATKMREVNDEKNYTRICPGEASVTGWIEQAKNLDPAIKY